jgi:DNA end-binding protein Ku
VPRSLASLTITFGLVAIPVRLYSSALRQAVLRFRYMTAAGDPVRQRLEADAAPAPVADVHWNAADDAAAQPPETSASKPALGRPLDPAPDASLDERAGPLDLIRSPIRSAPAQSDARGQAVDRSSLRKGLEIEPGRFVLFTPEELEALATPPRDSIDVVAFVPPDAVDPVYVQKSYYLTPAERGARPFGLLVHAMQRTRRCALARWAWRGREHPALIRPAGGALVLHQLHAGDAVRPVSELGVEPVAVSAAELELAERLVEQLTVETFDPLQFIDPARQRILDAARRKLAGGETVERRRLPQFVADSSEVVDLLAALRASLATPTKPRRPPRRAVVAPDMAAQRERRRG